MPIRSQQLGARGVSMDMKTSWAVQEYDSSFVNLETMARFQQKQLQEKEQKLLQLYDQQQQRAYQVVQRSSAGSAVRTTTTSTSQGGKVRQMFDERRHTKGIDRSYPLEPLENKLRKQTNVNGVAMQRNGNLTTVNRQSVSVKRMARADVNSNINGGKPVVSYHEEISRESFGPSVRRHDDDDEDEYGVENRVAAFANGYYRHEADNEQEDALDHETMERNRMMAKIHLMGFDESLKHRVRNDLESEEFPEYLMANVPDKLSKRNVTKKLSQAEARLERFKNANAKRNNTPKQSTPIGNSMKKRSEQTVSTKANSRITKSPSPDSTARKQHETNTRATRGSASTSPSKSPDIVPRHTSTESKNQEAKPSRKSTIAKGADSIGNKAVTTRGTVDAVDGVVLQNGSPHEFTTKSSDAFVIDYDDRSSKEDNAIPPKKSSTKKSSMDKQQTASGSSGRPISSESSTSSAGSAQGQVSSTKGKMAPRRSATVNGDLVACPICKRHFAKDRINYHKQICEKSLSKKRKPFDSVMTRVRGTDLEPFVKKNLSKKEKPKAEKLQMKPNNWRRQHEDFINTIRSAKQVQVHLAAGGNLRDLPPPPPSDTSDYIQCPHCGRRFSPPAAERHIPKCQHMLHNKPAPARALRR